MDDVFTDEFDTFVLVYCDAILIYSAIKEERKV